MCLLAKCGCIDRDASMHSSTFWQKPLILTWAAILSILVFVEWKEIFFLNNIFIIVEWYLALKRRNLKFLKRHHNNITLASPLSILLQQATMTRWGVDFQTSDTFTDLAALIAGEKLAVYKLLVNFQQAFAGLLLPTLVTRILLPCHVV